MRMVYNVNVHNYLQATTQKLTDEQKLKQITLTPKFKLQ